MKLEGYVSWISPFMDSGRTRGDGVFVFTRQSKSLALFKMKMSLVFTKRLVGAMWNS